MAEVTREMILEYMQAKNGVVKNVDLVRHFRKHLQQSDSRARDLARNQFKARVDEVAYIRADDKGEKYLYLNTDLAHSSTASSGHSAGHSVILKRDSISSNHSSGDRYSSGRPNPASNRTPPRDSPRYSTGGSIPASPATTSSVQSRPPSEQPTLSSEKEPSFSLLGDSLFKDSALSSFFGGGVSGLTTSSSATPSGSSTAGREASGSATTATNSNRSGTPARETSPAATKTSSTHSGTTVRGTGISTTRTSSSRNGTPARETSPVKTSSHSGTRVRESGISGSRGGKTTGEGGTAGLTNPPTARGAESTGELGEGSSFAADILNSFFGATTTATGSSGLFGERRGSSSSSSHSTPSHSSAGRSAPHRTSNKATRSEVPGTSSRVTLQSYKPLTSPSHATTRSPSPPPPSHTTTRVSPPHQPTPQPSPAKPSPSPPRPPPRNPSYTTTYNTTSSGSVFSPPPPQTSPTGGDLLSQMTSQLSSFGEIGSLMDSFMSSEPATNNNTLTSDRSSKTGGVADSFDRSSKREGVADSLDRSSKFGTGSYTSSGQTSGSVIARLPSSSQQRGSPPKSSTTFATVHSSSPPVAPGSPMRVPRMNGGPSSDPAPPYSSSSLGWSNGPLDGDQQPPRQLSQETFPPHIHIQRVDSQRSDTSSNGVLSPPHHITSTATTSGGGGVDVRSRVQGLPPLPPSARTSAATANGGPGVALRPQDRAGRERAQSAARRSRILDRTSAATQLESVTRASILMTPPPARRSVGAAFSGVGMYARPAPGSREDLSQGHSDGGDQDGSLSAPSEDYEVDPLEKEWMLACASADMDEMNTLMIQDSALINHKDFLHGYTALHWAAKQGRCDIMSALILNGAFPNIKSNGGFTPLHLACQGGCDNAIAMLVRDHGANVNARDNSGRKPVDMLEYSCSEGIRALLTDRLKGNRIVHHSSEMLSSFSQPRIRLGSLSNAWASMPNSLESSDEKKKRFSPKLNKRTFSFRNRLKVNSPNDKKERPRSYIPETYDA